MYFNVGPEGDFTEKEIETLTANYGFVPVTIGKRILRAKRLRQLQQLVLLDIELGNFD